MNKSDKRKYYVKYTAGSYADAFMSIPLGLAKLLNDTKDGIRNRFNPDALDINTWEEVKEHTPFYKTRKNLRDKLDTKPGMKFLQSNVIAGVPFVVAGIPAAEYSSGWIEEHMSDAPEIVKYVSNSLATLTAQMTTAYAAFMGNEIRTNKEKYINEETGKLSARKIYKGVKMAAKAFLKFDLSYVAGKTVGQTGLLYMGKDPAIASTLFDSVALPAFYAVAIPLGLGTGIIKTKETERLMEKE